MKRAFFLLACVITFALPVNGQAVPAATVHLKQGFNLVALHAEADLGNWLSSLGFGLETEKVMAYDAQTGQFVILNSEDPSPDPFWLHGGDGLIVYATSEKNVSIPTVACSDFQFKQGFKLVGIACRGQGYSASDLLNELGSSN